MVIGETTHCVQHDLLNVLLLSSEPGVAKLLCLVTNGFPSSNEFLQIIVTTRNARFDELVGVAYLRNVAVTKNEMNEVCLRHDDISCEFSGKKTARSIRYGGSRCYFPFEARL